MHIGTKDTGKCLKQNVDTWSHINHGGGDVPDVASIVQPTSYLWDSYSPRSILHLQMDRWSDLNNDLIGLTLLLTVML